MGNVRAKLRFFKPDKGIFNYICIYDIVYVIRELVILPFDLLKLPPCMYP